MKNCINPKKITEKMLF